MTLRSTPKNLRLALLGVATLLLLLFTAGSVIYLNQSRSRDQLLMEFAVSRAASLLTEAYLQGDLSSESQLPENVVAFGLYDERGGREAAIGPAPDRLGDQAYLLELSGNRLRLIRPVGQTGFAPPTGGGWGGWEGGRGMRERRMPMMQMMPMMGSPPMGRELQGRDLGLRSYTEYNVADYRDRSRQLLYFILLALGTTLLLFALLLLILRRLQRAEAQVQESRRMAELGEAARTLTHEIRNPLGALKMQTSLLKRSLSTEHEESLGILNEEIARISYLVDRVREFLKNPSGEPEALELRRFVEEMSLPPEVRVDTGPNSASQTGVGPPLQVSADPQKLRSVVENLVNNAREANLEAGSTEAVTLEVRAEGGVAVLLVCDRGAGIPDEIGEKIFDPFFTTKTQGSGVGLAIAKRFVEAAGGDLSYRARPDGGSCFEVRLPKRGT